MNEYPRLIEVVFSYNDQVQSKIIAIVSDVRKGFEELVKQAYANYTTDKNIPYDTKSLDSAIKQSGYKEIGSMINLGEDFKDFEVYNIIQLKNYYKS